MYKKFLSMVFFLALEDAAYTNHLKIKDKNCLLTLSGSDGLEIGYCGMQDSHIGGTGIPIDSE